MNKELIETEVKLAGEKIPRKNTPNGPGKRLQAARTAANIPLESVALALHLTTQMVSDLENDNYARFAGHTFIRGYLRNYARLLGLSPDELIASFNNLELSEHESDKPKLALKTACRKRQFRPVSRNSLLKVIILSLVVAVGSWYMVKQYKKFSVWQAPDKSQATNPKDMLKAEVAGVKQASNNEAPALMPLTLEKSELLLKSKQIDLPKNDLPKNAADDAK